jgi:DNA-binding transcriptional regulator YhcF (GntR family)
VPRKRESPAKSPFVSHIVATLAERIRTGAYPGGRWLPTERELCSEFAVSRAILRQALLELERSDLVIRAAGCRPFVKADIHTNGSRNEGARCNIGLCVKHDPKYSGTYLITQGIRQATESDAYRLVIAGAGATTLDAVAEEEAQALLRMVRDEDISGIILWYCGGSANLPILHAVQSANIPMVFVDRAPPEGIEGDYVTVDNQRAARDAVEYLFSH